MPTRKITSSPVKVTGTVPNGQKFESVLEEDFFLLLRFNHLVDRFESQSVTVEWRDKTQKIRTYTPDVLVHYRKDVQDSATWPSLLCEVKPDFTAESESPRRHKPPRDENEEENQLKWMAAERYAAKKGWAFKVVRESEIRTPFLQNARFLLRHLERGVASPYEPKLLSLLAEQDSMTLVTWAESLANSREERARVLPACYRLIATQQVAVDLSTLLTMDSTIKAALND